MLVSVMSERVTVGSLICLWCNGMKRYACTEHGREVRSYCLAEGPDDGGAAITAEGPRRIILQSGSQSGQVLSSDRTPARRLCRLASGRTGNDFSQIGASDCRKQ